VFTFADSNHSKYASYMLEMTCNFELESSPQLKKVFFDAWLVNSSGQAGDFMAGDRFQEQLQDELYERIPRNDLVFGDSTVQNILAPNTHRFVEVKKAQNAGLGLTDRSSAHTEPSTDPEHRCLGPRYEELVLNEHNPGRQFDLEASTVDDHGRGYCALRDGKWRTWCGETIRAREYSFGSLEPAVEDAEAHTTFIDSNEDILAEGANDPEELDEVEEMYPMSEEEEYKLDKEKEDNADELTLL
jgi:hypothetical protein